MRSVTRRIVLASRASAFDGIRPRFYIAPRLLPAAAPDRTYTPPDAPKQSLYWPHPNVGRFMPNDGDLVDLVPEIAPDEVLREKLLVQNPARLYGWA